MIIDLGEDITSILIQHLSLEDAIELQALHDFARGAEDPYESEPPTLRPPAPTLPSPSSEIEPESKTIPVVEAA